MVKHNMDDHELLREFVRRQSQDAFRQLVERHLPMVYSAARRMVRDPQLAEDVAQTVFTTLAEKARGLGGSSILGGWLYNTTRNLALHAVRAEARRRQREATAVAMQSLESSSQASPILEHLEPAMAELDDAERDALVLRYLEDRSLREVGQELGVSEDAARMRVNRALDRLRLVFAQQGIAVTPAALAAALAAGAICSVPAGLSAATAATTLAAAGAAATPAILAVSSMLNTKAIASVIATALVAGTGTYLVQQRQVERLKAENQNLLARQQQTIADQESALQAAPAAKEQPPASVAADNSELLRLRNEVTQLRRERDAAKRGVAATPTPASPTPPASPGRYITKDQLAFAGYATPEASLQSMTWAMLNGSYEQSIAALAPEMQQQELNDPKNREQFESGQKMMAPLFKGMQVLARKKVAEDRVELKVKLDAGPLPNSDQKAPEFSIQPMVKIGNEWKLGGSTRSYDAQWDQDDQAEPLAR
jgi:RNA polymerase sigma factor (sigma-70 family)